MIAESLLWLTLNVYHESRGEPDIAQIAVAHVTMNRTKESQSSVSTVVRKKKQFSWVRKKKQQSPWVTDTKIFAKCGRNAVRALHGVDITKGATYFHKVGVKPEWAK